MQFIVNIQREKESRMTYCSRSENISPGRHALTSIPRLTPRLGLCQSISPSTDIFRSRTRGHSWFSYDILAYQYPSRLYIWNQFMKEAYVCLNHRTSGRISLCYCHISGVRFIGYRRVTQPSVTRFFSHRHSDRFAPLSPPSLVSVYHTITSHYRCAVYRV